MRLEEYIEDVGISIPKLAKKAGLNPLTLRNVISGKKNVYLTTAIALEVATKEQVTYKEMLPKKLLEQALEGVHHSHQGPKKKEEKNKSNKKK